jgi:hypothetical protein
VLRFRALIPRQQPLLERRKNRLLKESKARSCANPDDDRQTGEGKAPQFPSIFKSMEKDFFHTVL